MAYIHTQNRVRAEPDFELVITWSSAFSVLAALIINFAVAALNFVVEFRAKIH